jgi:hypothetical protein
LSKVLEVEEASGDEEDKWAEKTLQKYKTVQLQIDDIKLCGCSKRYNALNTGQLLANTSAHL